MEVFHWNLASFLSQTDEVQKLTGQVELSNAQKNAIQEERDNLKSDLENTHLAKDEIVKKVRNIEVFIFSWLI